MENKFITKVNDIIFSQSSNTYFPIDIKLSKLSTETIDILKQFDLPIKNEIHLTNKQLSDDILNALLPIKDLKIGFNYSKFISHPGNLFIKNLSKSRISHAKLFKFFNSNSLYKSLTDLNLFNVNSNNDDEIFGILKFDNYLDVDYLLNKKFTHNPFNVNLSYQLYLNRYISKKERKLFSEDVDDYNNYGTLVLENLFEFFPEDYDFNLSNLNKFINKFQQFGNIQSIYFPVKVNNDSSDPSTGSEFTLLDFGFINFEYTETSNMNLLKCVYFLNNTNFEQFMDFDETLMADITNDINENNESNDNNQTINNFGIKISISQHKHNHHLYHYHPNILSFDDKILSLNLIDYNYHSILINGFIKHFNYQETNIYVNNFPTLFKNDDKLWEFFWQQFGSIKLAKIIKPQFYSKENQTKGKIGFVFFEDFRMALKAIILTNNKLVNYDNTNCLIKTSFAFQKLGKEKRKKSLDAIELPTDVPKFIQHPQIPLLPGNQMFYYDHAKFEGDDEESKGNYTTGTHMMQHVPQYLQHPYFYPMLPATPMPYFPYYNFVPKYPVSSYK